ncbi:hypothetical protein [Streptomyces sp. NPDC001594]|uniref:hypothetical protein n=1 Tax=Streptomyces sp. NPDC001594 TaxID=3364590 RepID=UPI00368D546B
MRRAQQHRRLLAVAAITTTAAALTAGCTAEPSRIPPPASASRPAVTPSIADPQAEAKTKILATYSAFWAESVKAYEAGTEQGTKLVDYAAKDALNQTLTDIANMQRAGTTMKGAPGHRPEVSAVNLSGGQPTATISDCFDLSTWKIIDRSSGQVRPFPTEQPMHYITVFDAELQGGRWMLTKFVRHGDRTC